MVEHLGVGEGKVEIEVWRVATLHVRSHILLVLPLTLALLHWRGFTFPLNSLVLGASPKVHAGIRHWLQLEAGVRISSRARAQKFLLRTHLLTFHVLRFFLTLGHRLGEGVLSTQRRSAAAGEPCQRQRGGMGRRPGQDRGGPRPAVRRAVERVDRAGCGVEEAGTGTPLKT